MKSTDVSRIGGQTQNIMKTCEELNELAHASEMLGLDQLGHSLRMKASIIKSNADTIYLTVLNE